jgi:tetratricopeptide (TPR) repeat protein
MRGGGNGIFAALTILLAAALLAGEGRFFWVGGGAVLAAAVALAVVLPRPTLGRAGVVSVALFCAFALWMAASVLWSAAPDRSWDFLNRTLVYLAFLALGLFGGPRLERRYEAVLAALLGLLVGWALIEKVFALDDGRRARLNEPIGYWNALALLAASAVPLALQLARRLLAVLLVYASVVAIVLTQSRGGLLLAALAGAGWLALERARYEPAFRLAVAVPPALAVGAFGLTLDGISVDQQPHSERLADGLWLGLALLLGTGLVAGLARLDVPEPRRGTALRAALAVVVPVALVAVAVVGARAAMNFSEPVTPEGPGRVFEGSSNNRAQWWREAAHGFADHPLAGNGAGAFQVTHRLYRDSNVEVREPHSLPLQLLSETGLVGFALFAGAAAAAAFAVRRERALYFVVGLFALGVLFDIHWDSTAAGAVAFATLGVLLPRGDRPGGRAPLWAAGVVTLALAALYSLGAPWLADRGLDDAYAAIARGDLVTAADEAQRANSLDPVSVEPLFALGFVEFAQGQFDRARDYYARATEVQPQNRETWFLLGKLEYDVKRYDDAYGRFNRMYALDPHGPHVAWVKKARCKINPTGC